MGALRVHRLALVLASLMAIACGGYQPEVVRRPAAPREEFDPQTLDDDDFLLQPPKPTATSRGPARPALSPAPPAPAASQGDYTVQLAALQDEARARAFQSEAQKQFSVPVSVAYDGGARTYKVQVGSFRTAAEALSLYGEARARGYGGAFVSRSGAQGSTPDSAPTVEGFRLQLYSVSSPDAAERERERAMSILGRSDVYVDYDAPFYKVRVGDFLQREEAEALIEGVRQKGYRTPFVVRAQILIPSP